MGTAAIIVLSMLFQVGLDTAQKLMNGLDKKQYDKLSKMLNEINTKMSRTGLSATKTAQQLGYYSEIMSKFPNISKVYEDTKRKSDELKAKYDQQLAQQQQLIDNAKEVTDKINKINPNQTVGERIGQTIEQAHDNAREWVADVTKQSTKSF